MNVSLGASSAPARWSRLGRKTDYIRRPISELFNKKKPVMLNANRAKPNARLRAKAFVVIPRLYFATPASPLRTSPKSVPFELLGSWAIPRAYPSLDRKLPIILNIPLSNEAAVNGTEHSAKGS